jgi:threonine dehydrogenase-like Zn-dependent dehydrogenase
MLVGEVTDPGEFATRAPTGTVLLLPVAHGNYHDLNMNDSWLVRNMIELADKTCAEEAAFLSFALISATAPYLAPPNKTSNVAVVGMGPVGQLALQLYANRLVAEKKPERTVGFDVSAQRVKVATMCGCEAVAVPPGQPWAESFTHVFGATGPDIIVEATGNARVAAGLMEGARSFATVVLLGSTRFPVEIDLYKWIHAKCLRVLGAHARALGEHPEKKVLAFQLYDAIKGGELVIKPMITDQLPLERAAEGYQRLLRDPENHMGVILKA